jgi:hypothetical protein
VNTRAFALAALWAPALWMVACGKEGDAEPVTWADVQGPDEGELVRDDLGNAPIGDTGGYIDVEVEVPADAVSTSVHCGDFGDLALGALWTLTDPEGNVVYDGSAPLAGDYTAYGFRSDFVDDTTAVLLPATPSLPLAAGTWQLQYFVGAGSDGDASCAAVHRTGGESAQAEVFVNLVFVGPEGLDAATAIDDENFQQVLATFESEWGSGSITPQYNYLDFDGDKAKFAVVDVTDDEDVEFNELLRTAKPGNARTLTFFFVEEIANGSAGGATILGLSAGPPGAAAQNGTSASGLVISAIDYDAAPDDVGKIMAHEGGHFLGLYHTTEKDGARHDLLGDTPECDPSNDANGNGTMNSDECAGKGAENVMWWTLTSGEATLSDDQSWVLRRNPVVD